MGNKKQVNRDMIIIIPYTIHMLKLRLSLHNNEQIFHESITYPYPPPPKCNYYVLVVTIQETQLQLEFDIFELSHKDIEDRTHL